MHAFKYLLALACWTAAETAQAGIYCSLDGARYPVPTTFKDVNIWLAGVRAPRNVEQGQQARQQLYSARVAQLLALEQAAGLTVDERIELSGLLLRLKSDGVEARRVLEAGEKTHVLVLAHLAMAYFQLGLLDRAIAYQQEALAAWPAVSLRWNQEQLAWYRRSERYFLELLLRRQRAERSGQSNGQTVDALFPKLQPLLEATKDGYQLGGPRKSTERLLEDVPPDALPLVVQLLFWLPFDNQLFWLYGELLNQRGDVVGAEQALSELVVTRKLGRTVPLLFQHQRALQEGATLWNQRRDLFFLARPPIMLAPPVVGVLGGEAAQLLASATARLADDDPASFSAGTLPSAAPTPTVSERPAGMGLPDWRTIAVSFIAGMICMSLAWLQWREWSRRRTQARSPRQPVAG